LTKSTKKRILAQMNIFSTSPDPFQSARWLVDKHCVKMLLESTQLLCTAFHEQGIDAPYKPSHRNHPSSIWTRLSYDNFQWLIAHAHGISEEYTARYGKIHKSKVVLDWCEDHAHLLGFDLRDLTKFAIAIADDMLCRKHPDFTEDDPVAAYRLYIKLDKQHIHTWKRNKPNWV
jgi:hypothetical protein